MCVSIDSCFTRTQHELRSVFHKILFNIKALKHIHRFAFENDCYGKPFGKEFKSDRSLFTDS